MTLHQRFQYHAKGVQRRAHPHDDQRDREDLPRHAQRMDLAEPDRGNRRDRLVDGVEQAESEHEVADAASDNDPEDCQQG